ncbi:YebC/PmpR family DNA-binding transcriptional regulator [Candidatus Margulisiibacteriota bacterium]
MSGHNKWSTIKHKKAKTDAAKGKAFTKAAMEIMAAVKAGGPDAGGNSRLRMAIQSGKDVNMPNDNIKRAIEKASGGGDGVIIEDITYEGYGPEGVALLIQVTTDNRNRAASEVRSTLEKNGGNLGSSGSVAWVFDQKGVIVFEPGKATEEKVMEIAIDAGAEDILANEDGSIEVSTSPDSFMKVREALEKAKLEMASAKLSMIPKNTVKIEDPETAKKIMGLVDALEEKDDVQNVYANYDIPDAIMSKFE